MPVLEGNLVNYYDCFHATPAGARVVATSVAAAIVHGRTTGALASAGADRHAACVVSRAS